MFSHPETVIICKHFGFVDTLNKKILSLQTKKFTY